MSKPPPQNVWPREHPKFARSRSRLAPTRVRSNQLRGETGPNSVERNTHRNLRGIRRTPSTNIDSEAAKAACASTETREEEGELLDNSAPDGRRTAVQAGLRLAIPATPRSAADGVHTTSKREQLTIFRMAASRSIKGRDASMEIPQWRRQHSLGLRAPEPAQAVLSKPTPRHSRTATSCKTCRPNGSKAP